jgi:hypothetical protein
MRVRTISKGELLYTIAGILLAEEVRDGRIVVRGVLECLECVLVPACLRDLPLLQLL